MDLPLERPKPFTNMERVYCFICCVYEANRKLLFWYMLRAQERDNAEPIAIVLYLPVSSCIYYGFKAKDAELLTDRIESPIDYYKLIEGNQYIPFKEKDVIHIKTPNPNFDYKRNTFIRGV